jgi:hypothetical protein
MCHQIAFIATHLQIEQPFLCRMLLRLEYYSQASPDLVGKMIRGQRTGRSFNNSCAALYSSVTLVLSPRHPLFAAYFVAYTQTSRARSCSFVGAGVKEYSFSCAWVCLGIEWTLRVLCATRPAMLHPLELYTITRAR